MNNFLVFLMALFGLLGAVLLLVVLGILYTSNTKGNVNRKSWLLNLKESFAWRLDANKPLHHHGLFWLTALMPPIIGTAISISVMHTYEFCWCHEGLTFWVESNKLPLGFMALGIPFGVMVGSFHKTKQTAEQIKQTQSSLKPVLTFSNSIIDRNRFYLNIRNSGLGPALIKKASLSLAGNLSSYSNGDEAKKLVESFFGSNEKITVRQVLALNSGYVFSSGYAVDVIKIDISDDDIINGLTDGAMDVSFVVEYVDIFGNVFIFPSGR